MLLQDPLKTWARGYLTLILKLKKELSKTHYWMKSLGSSGNYTRLWSPMKFMSICMLIKWIEIYWTLIKWTYFLCNSNINIMNWRRNHVNSFFDRCKKCFNRKLLCKKLPKAMFTPYQGYINHTRHATGNVRF